jgi:hypothetical protein
MIGLAMCLGFKKIVLVGCDYTFNPPHSLHFFENGVGQPISGMTQYSVDFFKMCQERVEVLTLVPNGMKSGYLQSISYKELTGADEVYRENDVLISPQNLLSLGCHKHYLV